MRGRFSGRDGLQNIVCEESSQQNMISMKTMQKVFKIGLKFEYRLQ